MKNRLFVNNNTIILFLFIIGSILFIELNFRYWYRFLEQYMMFQTTGSYFQDRLAEPGGLNEYVTEFLSLAFIHPYGASVVIALLLGLISGCFFLYLKACGVRASMLAAILPSFLIWIYPQESIALLTMLAFVQVLAYLYTSIKIDWLRYLFGFLFLGGSYFFAAPANLLLALLIAVYECCAKEDKARFGVAIIAIAWGGLLPLIAMRTVYILPMREAFFSKHLCHPEYPIPNSLGYIGLSYPLIVLILYYVRNRVFIRKESWKRIVSYAFLLIAMTYGILYKKDPMEQAYRYDYYARQGEWQEIVSHARAHSVRDMDALIYLNLALSHTGRFSGDLMRFPQIGVEGFIPHDPKSRMGLIEASEVAWQVGQVNAAQRFAFVGVLSSQRCVQPRLMKRLVETYLVTGEYRAAEKYIKILESTPHYRDWAKAQRPLLDSVVCASTDWIKAKRAVLPVTDNPLDLTLTFPNALAFLIDDHADNRPAFEYGMGYLLVYKDLMTFMHYMELMKERGESFPVLYQEAICLFFAAVQKDPEAFKSYPISSEVQNRFLQFMKVARGMHDKVRYNLCRVAFDPDRGEISFPIDTLVHADSLSYTFPRISPDGRFLMYTETAYGQFPIWHPDAEIRMMDLENRTAMDMSALNSPDTDSYHSWSSNSDWVVFSSRRDNGLYTLPYICYIGKDGKPSKPFLLPQEDPDKYDYQLYSYNIPELTKGAVEVSPYEIQQVAEKNKPEQVRFK